MNPVFRLISAEITKSVRLKLPWLGLGFSVLVAFFARQYVEGFAAPGEISTREYLTTNVNLLSTAIIPIFSTIFASSLIASETSRGSLRLVLPRPIYRSHFLHAKLTIGVLYLLLLFVVNLAVALPIALGYPERSAFDEGVELPSRTGQIMILGIALGLTLLPHLATVCFGFLVSVLSRSVATAIGVAVGLIFCMLPIQALVEIGSVRIGDYMFSSYYDDAMGIGNSIASGITSESWRQQKVYYLLATSLISSVVFLTLAYRVFTRRDFND